MLVVQGEMLVGQGEMVVIQGEMVVHQDTGRVGESKWSCLITVTPCYQTICVCVCLRVWPETVKWLKIICVLGVIPVCGRASLFRQRP